MKKLLVMLLVASMSFFVVACGGNDSVTNNESTNSENQENNENTTNNSDSESEVDYTEILLNDDSYWLNTHGIGIDRKIIFGEDNTYLSGITLDELGTWEINDTTLTITSEDGNNTYYEIKDTNGVCFLIGNNDILCNGRLDTSEFPIKEVEITIDNWQEYFEIATYTVENVGAFGDVTETPECFLKLKDEYYKYLINYSMNDITSEVVLRCKSSPSSESSDCYMDIKRDCSLFGYYWDEMYELAKIQGTLYFFDIE